MEFALEWEGWMVAGYPGVVEPSEMKDVGKNMPEFAESVK